MSQLTNQILKPTTMPLMGPLTQNIGIINQAGMPQLIQNQANLQVSNNMQNIAQSKLPIQNQENKVQESN